MNFVKSILNFLFPSASLRNSRTVHYAFSFLFLFAAVMGMAAVASREVSSVKIIASTESVEIGTSFSIDVYVNASTPVNAVAIAL